MESVRVHAVQDNEQWNAAMVITGCAEYPINTQALEIMTSSPDSFAPVLITEAGTDEVMAGIYDNTFKLNFDDFHRVKTAVSHYEPYIDFDLLLQQVDIDRTAKATA